MLRSLLIFFIIILAGTASAQQFLLQGSATQTGPATYQMTADLLNQAGMATNYYPLDLTSNFTLNFQLNFGVKDVNGADGLAFVLSNTCNPTLTPGQGLGVANIPNSVVVDFDTWDNGVVYNDLTSDHSGIYGDGNFSAAGNIMDATSQPVCLLPGCGNVEDGNWYDAAIQWEYLSPTLQRVSVYFNGILLSTSTRDHIGLRFNGNTNVFWSISASTGGSSNLHQFRLTGTNNTYSYCEGANFTLTAPVLGSGYTWTNNGSTTNTASYTATTTGIITCNFTNYCGINQTVSFTINVPQLNSPVITNDGPVCINSNGNFTITGLPNYGIWYSINGGPGQTGVLNASGVQIIPVSNIIASTGILITQISDGTCNKTISITDTIRLLQLATPLVTNNGPVCSGTDGIFQISGGTPGDLIIYSLNGGSVQNITLDAAGAAPIPVIAVTIPQFIQLSLVMQGTCSAIINRKDTIRSKPLPAAPTITNNGPVCAATSAIFNISGAIGSQINYTLNGGAPKQITIPASGMAQVIIPAVNSLQTLILTNIHSTSNCDLPLNQSSSISILPLIASSLDISICEGLNYLGYTRTGVYRDTFPSAQGCDSVRTLNLIVIKTSKPKLGPDRVICPGDTIVLNPGNFTTYLWQDGSGLPLYTVTGPGTYSVSVNASCGVISDEVIVTRGVCDVYFSSGFSPNKDGKNDQFKVLTDLKLSSYDLKIYDRWGGLVFHTTDQYKGWDGTINGSTLNSGIFVWLSTYSYNGQTKLEKGTLMLMR